MRLPFALTILALAIGLGCVSVVPTDGPAQSIIGAYSSAERVGQGNDSCKTFEPNRADLLDRISRTVLASVVDIHTDVDHEDVSPQSQTATRRPESARLSTGSGVVVAADGWILTNEHVVRDARSVSVELSDGTRHRVSQVAVHPKLDLAVLRIDRQDLKPLRFINSPAERGMRVLAVAGSAFLDVGPVRVGVVTQTQVSLQHELDPRRTRLYDHLIESTTKIEPGFSGGPLVDSHGYIVGINVAVSGEGAGDYCRGYAIPLHAGIRETVALLIDRARSASAWSPTASRR